KPEARMECIGTGSEGDRHDGRGIEEVEAMRSVGDRDDRADPESIAGPGDPSGDLAAVRNEDRSDRGRASSKLAPARIRPRERVNCVRSDTPSAADAAGRKAPARDPALDRPWGGSEPLGGLPRTELVSHRVVSVALVP